MKNVDNPNATKVLIEINIDENKIKPITVPFIKAIDSENKKDMEEELLIILQADVKSFLI